MNEALGQLLTTRAILNSCQRELVQNTDIARHQNEIQATEEAIKEVEDWCAPIIREAEATIKEAETHHEVMIKETETHHATQAYDLNNPMRKVCLNWSMKC